MAFADKRLKILVITNYYPPSPYGGGYMQLCEEVTEGLAQRGHHLQVLTSTSAGNQSPQKPYPIHRLLPIDPDWYSGKSALRQFFIGRRQREGQAVAALRRIIGEYHPDFLFIWHGIGLPRAVLQAAEQTAKAQVVYFLAGYLPELPDEYIDYWRKPAEQPRYRWVKPVLAKLALTMLAAEGKPLRLTYPNVICVSEYVRSRLVSNELIAPQAVVIHNGIDLALFAPRAPRRVAEPGGSLKCLIAGNLIPEKGIHTAIEAFRLLANDVPQATLTIIGSGSSDYIARLLQQRDAAGLTHSVKFQAAVPREQLPAIMEGFDVFLLPSEYDEPLARSIQEAMAMGLLVIGTNTGGSGELLVQNCTGLVFTSGDARSLCDQMTRAANSPQLVKILRDAGQAVVRNEFDISKTVERIETYLLALAQPVP